jgi:Protein of unknown function (DUF1565)
MKTMSIRKSQVLASLLLFLTSAALAKTVQVGTCLPNSQTYSTISQAVSSVPPGSTVLVCPGTYPEQVTITQPLTLRGVQNGNAANPTIIVPAGGLTKTVATGVGNFYYQLLANNGTSGAVNVSNITVVGSGNGLPNAAPLAGVFYNNTSGTVSRMAIFNQLGTGVGYGLIAYNTGSSAVTVSVLRCSIHDFDQGGVSIGGNLTATIKSNEIVTSNSFSGSSAPSGIDLYSSGTVANNLVITHPQPPGVSANAGISIYSDVVVANNTVEDFSIGIWALGDSATVTSNKVLLAADGVVISGNNNYVEHNSFTNGGDGISFNCTGTGNTVIHNVFNDVYGGIVEPHGTNTIAPNTFINVAKVISPPC